MFCKAIVSDAAAILKNTQSLTSKAASAIAARDGLIFDPKYRFTSIFIDEVHEARKKNRLWHGLSCLISMANATVAMTATPIEQAPEVCELHLYH